MRRRPISNTRHLPRDLVILHEDEDILVVDKPAGLLTIATDRDKSRTAYFMLTNYVRKGVDKSPRRIFIVHRLDRETSGLLLFAKSEAAKSCLQSQWKDTAKKYLAVVHGTLAQKSGTITTYLAENSAHVVYSTNDPTKGKIAHTAYHVLREAKGLSLLEVDLLTGRKNQIRVHLAGIGHPILGDKKYGMRAGSHARLALHARSISFKHPRSGKQLTFETEVPAYFRTLSGQMDREPGRENPSPNRFRRSVES